MPAKKSPKEPAKAEAEAPPTEASPEPETHPPTSAEVRRAKKAQLVAWCTELGLDAEGTVDELRKRLLGHLEAEAEAEKEEAEAAPAPAAPKEAEVAVKAAKAAKAPPKEAEEEAEEEAEVAHVARLKPTLDARTRALLELRSLKSAARPRFRRQEWFRHQRLGTKWRAPRGGQSKLRRHFGYRWNVPSSGYRGPRDVRGLHASGFQEVLVHNARDVEAIDPARQAARIGRGVGARKRELIQKACEERGVRVLNPMVSE